MALMQVFFLLPDLEPTGAHDRWFLDECSLSRRLGLGFCRH